MAWNNFRGRQNFGIFEPRAPMSDALAMSSHERVKKRMLDLQYDVEDATQEYLQYQIVGKIPTLQKEKLQSKVITLFISCRPHIENYLRREEQKVKKIKDPDEKKHRAQYLTERQQTYQSLREGFLNLHSGRIMKEDILYHAISFLVQFIYDVGVSRIEMPDRDPIKDFSMAAYGEDFTPKEEEAEVLSDASDS